MSIVKNRQAGFNYTLSDSFKAGIVLEGWEVKAILAGQATFNGGSAFVRLRDSAAWLEGFTVTPLTQANKGLLQALEPARPRKLLLNKAELKKLSTLVQERGYALVPTEIIRERKLKLLLSVGKGKTRGDKRETIKARDAARRLAD